MKRRLPVDVQQIIGDSAGDGRGTDEFTKHYEDGTSVTSMKEIGLHRPEDWNRSYATMVKKPHPVTEAELKQRAQLTPDFESALYGPKPKTAKRRIVGGGR